MYVCSHVRVDILIEIDEIVDAKRTKKLTKKLLLTTAALAHKLLLYQQSDKPHMHIGMWVFMKRCEMDVYTSVASAQRKHMGG